MSATRNCLLMLIVGVIIIPNGNIIGLSVTYICTEAFCSLLILAVLLCRPSKKYVSEKYGSKGKCFEKSYVIKTESMSEISGDLESLCDTWEIGMKQAFFINFICEELLLNIIKFGLDHKSKTTGAIISPSNLWRRTGRSEEHTSELQSHA